MSSADRRTRQSVRLGDFPFIGYRFSCCVASLERTGLWRDRVEMVEIGYNLLPCKDYAFLGRFAIKHYFSGVVS